MRLNLAGIGAGILLLLVIAWLSMFQVLQTRQALVIRLGEIVRPITKPGLHFKWPFIESVVYIDNRILDLEVKPEGDMIASDQKRLVVDAFARYRITNPVMFYQTVNTIEGANAQLEGLLNSALRRVLGENALTRVVKDDRAGMMGQVHRQLQEEAKAIGIDIVDVRIKRADLPEANSLAVYKRMQTEREQEAAQLRAQGSERSQEVRAKADRDVTVLLAEAQAKADAIRGEGDGERNRIFAEAFNRDPDFFAFYRTMQAYEAGLRGDTRMLLKPDSDFFRFFVDPSGRPRTGGSTTSTQPETTIGQPGERR
jgi:membrane protease subunit HflC